MSVDALQVTHKALNVSVAQTLRSAVQVTNEASDVTMAHFMGEKGRRTPVAARFSTVTHEKGSPESLRDVRGFSVKMYTEAGNWDFVGNNIPVI